MAKHPEKKKIVPVVDIMPVFSHMLIHLSLCVLAGLSNHETHMSVYSEMNLENTLVLSRRSTPEARPHLRHSFNGSARNNNVTSMSRNGTHREHHVVAR